VPGVIEIRPHLFFLSFPFLSSPCDARAQQQKRRRRQRRDREATPLDGVQQRARAGKMPRQSIGNRKGHGEEGEQND
jgi:hypothetical protein